MTVIFECLRPLANPAPKLSFEGVALLRQRHTYLYGVTAYPSKHTSWRRGGIVTPGRYRDAGEMCGPYGYPWDIWRVWDMSALRRYWVDMERCVWAIRRICPLKATFLQRQGYVVTMLDMCGISAARRCGLPEDSASAQGLTRSPWRTSPGYPPQDRLPTYEKLRGVWARWRT